MKKRTTEGNSRERDIDGVTRKSLISGDFAVKIAMFDFYLPFLGIQINYSNKN
jgi:hypothetical protein